MKAARITEEQALFIATLPSEFVELSDAIRLHAFVNRVAAISDDNAREAIQFGLRAKLVEADRTGRSRLAETLRHQRETLESIEGPYEVAVSALSDRILAQSDE